MFGVNESTICLIRSKEKLICDAVKGSAPASAKTTHQVRDKAIVKMEGALFVWLEDAHKKGILVDTNVIQEKARRLYRHFKGEDVAEDPPGKPDPVATEVLRDTPDTDNGGKTVISWLLSVERIQ